MMISWMLCFGHDDATTMLEFAGRAEYGIDIMMRMIDVLMRENNIDH